MDQLVQCPVCTLYLHNGMSLECHLDTHPKDQVIKALCTLSVPKSNYGSRSSTPMHSERSFRSRSRTPATDDTTNNGQWSSLQSNSEHDRYWRRTPNRTPSSRAQSRTPKSSTLPRNDTPSDLKISDLSVDHMQSNEAPTAIFSTNSFPIKVDRPSQAYIPNGPVSDFDHHYVYIQDNSEESEMKYSRTAEYNASNNATSSLFAYNLQTPPGVRLQTALLPTTAKRNNDYVNMNIANNRDFIIPKPNNIALVKTNIGSLQYITPGVKPMHVMLPAPQTFIPKTPQSSLFMTGSIANSTEGIQNKTVTAPVLSNQFSQLTSSTFSPSKTMVTQNSQIIYREMVHNIDGKPYISGMPTVLSGHDSMGNVGQNSIYQNVMVVDPYGNTSCMYAPQQMLPQTTVTTTFNHNISAATIEKSDMTINCKEDQNKTLVLEIGPTLSAQSQNNVTVVDTSITSIETERPDTSTSKDIPDDEKNLEKVENPSGMKKGLKILSNIKVEVPVQHHKSMLNTIVDLTDNNDSEYPVSQYPATLDFDANKNENSPSDYNDMSPTLNSENSSKSNAFRVIKNVSKSSAHKDTSKTSVENKINDLDSTDSCPVPDLICNEKTSISPCSELTENGDNSIDHVPISPKSPKVEIPKVEPSTSKGYWDHSKSNNLYVKKHTKILKIKNAKTPGFTKFDDTLPSCSRISDTPIRKVEKISPDTDEKDSKQNCSFIIDKMDIPSCSNNFDDAATAEVQSMDIEPDAHSSFSQSSNFRTIDISQIKDEVNSSSETFSSEHYMSHDMTDKNLTPLESIRPINVVTYGSISENFDDDSDHRELLDLETSSKNKQFVNMMNENYFGDNIYADYFTPDRVESFDAARESAAFTKDTQKCGERADGVYLWEDHSEKETFVLPNFIHESYKIAENASCSTYAMNANSVLEDVEMGGADADLDADGEGCEQDSKLDVLSESRSESEVPLDICADEKMPPRGELSGQESNGDMDTPWTGMYPEVTQSESYDLMARESWGSDGSDVDSNEKPDDLEDDTAKTTSRFSCAFCDARVSTLKELHAHRAAAHAPAPAPAHAHAHAPAHAHAHAPAHAHAHAHAPAHAHAHALAPAPAPAADALAPKSAGRYSRLVTERAIKKEEEKPDDNSLETVADSKTGLTSKILFDDLTESKPKIEAMIKQEPRRRRDYVCPTCKVDQGSEALFREHLKIHPFECLTCGKCFYRRSNLSLHMRTHLGIRNFKCDVCEKRFVTKQKLQEHQNIHTGRAPVKCTFCDETFRRYSNMVQHRDRHHLNKKPKIRDFVCHCGEVFHSRAKLSWHTETHDDKPKACQYCSDKFVHAASLTRHVRRSHNSYYVPDGKKVGGDAENVPCPICKQVYMRSTLKAHLMTHSGKRPFACVICSKTFTTKWNLKLHRWVHMSRSSKPYKCTLCKGAFIRHSEYVSHMNAHKSVRPYTCNYCGCQFIRKYNCQRHVREHEMAKKYVCSVPDCGKTFHRSYYLTEHMRVHSGARPFSCSICGKTSSNKSNHNKHVRIHHTREPVATEA